MDLSVDPFGQPRESAAESEARMIAALAANRDRERCRARQKLAETLPTGTMLPQRGSAEAVTAVLYGPVDAPIFLSGGLTGIRLHFARMRDEERCWQTTGGVSLWRCGALFVLQAVNDDIASLYLSHQDGAIRRVNRKAPNRERVVSPRLPRFSAVRLA